MYTKVLDRISIGDTLYQIVRRVKDHGSPIIDNWKTHLRADKVFKKDGMYFFVREISDAEIVEELIETTVESPKTTMEEESVT